MSTQEREEQVDTPQGVQGADKLVEVFGYWPSFHDSEVVSFKLDRTGRSAGPGPSLDVLVHAFEMTSEVDAKGYYVQRNHVLVQLRFDEIDDLDMSGFNHQNVLMDIELVDLRDQLLEKNRWAVSFNASFGCRAAFQCRNFTVVSVTPCDKAGESINTPT